MTNDIASKIIKLSESNSPMKLLQITYAIIGIAFVLIAGIFSLFNPAIGASLLIVPAIALIAFCLNIVAWALISLAINSARDHQSRLKKSTTNKSSTRSKKTK